MRAFHVLSADFPLNDGGMFYVMVRDLQSSAYRLPDYTSYNSASIPFAYPPLPFYIAALLSDFTPLNLIDVFRFLPLIVSVLTIPAFFWLGRAILRSDNMALIAVFAFALLPRSFNWEIVGGGLTRSLGFMFALFALHQGYLLYTRRERKFALSSTILCGLTILCHLEMGWFVTFSFALFFLTYGRNRDGVVNSALVALGVLVVTAPWWGIVISQHGLSPFLSAAQSGGHSWNSVIDLVLFYFTEEPFLSLLAVLGLIGLFTCLAGRRYFLPVWLIAMFILDPRKASTYSMVPLAMLVSIAIADVILPSLSRLASQTRSTLSAASAEQPSVRAEGGRRSNQHSIATAFAVFLVLYAVVSAIATSANGGSPLFALSHYDREAMQWTSVNTPATSKFIVVSGTEAWAIDALSEWFPALTGRVSVATVQGYEWLGKQQYDTQQDQHEELQQCAAETVQCIESWSSEAGIEFSHIYVSKNPRDLREPEDCCRALRLSLLGSTNYEVIYDGPGATVFARRSSSD